MYDTTLETKLNTAKLEITTEYSDTAVVSFDPPTSTVSAGHTDTITSDKPLLNPKTTLGDTIDVSLEGTHITTLSENTNTDSENTITETLDNNINTDIRTNPTTDKPLISTIEVTENKDIDKSSESTTIFSDNNVTLREHSTSKPTTIILDASVVDDQTTITDTIEVSFTTVDSIISTSDSKHSDDSGTTISTLGNKTSANYITPAVDLTTDADGSIPVVTSAFVGSTNFEDKSTAFTTETKTDISKVNTHDRLDLTTIVYGSRGSTFSYAMNDETLSHTTIDDFVISQTQTLGPSDSKNTYISDSSPTFYNSPTSNIEIDITTHSEVTVTVDGDTETSPDSSDHSSASTPNIDITKPVTIKENVFSESGTSSAISHTSDPHVSTTGSIDTHTLDSDFSLSTTPDIQSQSSPIPADTTAPSSERPHLMSTVPDETTSIVGMSFII